MLIEVFKSKIHRATITGANLEYEGSISIDKNLLDAAGMKKHQSIWCWNINNGKRLMTYIIEAQRYSGEICLNGSAARLCQPGDKVILTTFAYMTEEELDTFEPTVVLVNPDNTIKAVHKTSGRPDSEI